MALQGNARLLISAPIESAYYATSYWSSIVTTVLHSAGARELEAPGSGSGAPPQKIFEFFYIKMACSGAF